jgi:hypothetical protein
MGKNLAFYDQDKIGKLISWAGDHRVYEYGNDQVIKFSLIERLMGQYGWAKVERDCTICKKFFGKFILETEFVMSRNGKQTAAIQAKIIGQFLVKKDLDNKIIASQFREIIDGYDLLVKAGNAKIDFIGRGGVFKRCMSNIFVTPENRLVIIDATLIECENTGIFKPIFLLVFTLATWLNNYTIKKFIT